MIPRETDPGVDEALELLKHVGDGYNDDGREVDFYFRDISFPATLPDWYAIYGTPPANPNNAGTPPVNPSGT